MSHLAPQTNRRELIVQAIACTLFPAADFWRGLDLLFCLVFCLSVNIQCNSCKKKRRSED